MKKIIIIALLTTLWGCQTSPKKNPRNVPLFYTPEQILKIQFSEQAGHLIWVKDSMAWIATDKIQEELDLSSVKNPKGWIVHLDPEGKHRVSFYREKDDGQMLSYADVFYDDNLEFTKLQINPIRALTVKEQQMLAALSTASDNITEACSENLNTVVLEEEAGWNVFLLTATTEPDVIPIGGAQRILVSQDGQNVIEKEHYSRACTKLEPMMKGAKLKDAFMTHLIDDVPSPIHVFTSLSYGIPLMVVTPIGAWTVVNGDIEEIKELNK
ncbi:MAG: hypothetical protein HUJ16_01295 [Kangiella sp.]|nr:hypothetical protein [Kangiella sp.]